MSTAIIAHERSAVKNSPSTYVCYNPDVFFIESVYGLSYRFKLQMLTAGNMTDGICVKSVLVVTSLSK